MSTYLTIEQVSTERQNKSRLDPLCQPSPPSIELLEMLKQLAGVLTLPNTLDEMLHSLATLTLRATAVDLCVILLKDKASGQFSLHTCAPDLNESDAIIEPVLITPVLNEQLHTSVLHSQVPALQQEQLATLNPLKHVQYKTFLPLPLMVGTDVIGFMHCYANRTLSYNASDQLLLLTIANQAALAIRHRLYIEEDLLARQTRINTFVEDLVFTNHTEEEDLYRHALSLGYELAKSHIVALVEITIDTRSAEEQLALYADAATRFKACVEETYPGSLVAELDGQLVCLLSLEQNATEFSFRFNDFVQQIGEEQQEHIAAGMGNTCHQVSDYRRSYAEAHEALKLGQTLHHQKRCTHFNELGVYRYIYKFASEDRPSDRYQQQISEIAEYDQHRKANLLDTLEMYLECGGNVAKTALLLDVHRNTLLQRLERLQKLCAINIGSVQNRLPLLIALKIYRVRSHCT